MISYQEYFSRLINLSIKADCLDKSHCPLSKMPLASTVLRYQCEPLIYVMKTIAMK